MSMKTAISIPDNLFEAAERVAKHLGISRSELYQRAISSFIADKSDNSITAELDQVYQTKDTGQLDPTLDTMQQLSLPRDEW